MNENSMNNDVTMAGEGERPREPCSGFILYRLFRHGGPCEKARGSSEKLCRGAGRKLCEEGRGRRKERKRRARERR